MRTTRPRITLAASLALAAGSPLAGQQTQQADSRLSVQRIFASRDFASAPLPSLHWLKDGGSYVDVRPAEGGGAHARRWRRY